MRLRIGLLALWLTLCGAAPALAQVAAPRLTPLFMGQNDVFGTVNPGLDVMSGALDVVNPAAQSWAGSSVVGAGLSTPGHYTLTDNVAGAPLARGDADSQVAQLRVLSDFVALNAILGRSKYRRKYVAGPVDGKFDVTDTRVELALRFADWMALGVARQASRDHVDMVPFPPATPDNEMLRTELQLPGASFRFGVLHLGFAAGSQEVRIENSVGVPGILGSTESDRRRISRTGVGVFDRGDDWGYHVEAYREEREGFRFPQSYPGFLLEEAKLSGNALEVIYRDVLIAFERNRTDNHLLFPGPPVTPIDFKSDLMRLSLGWVPKHGLNVVLTGQRAHRENTIADSEIATLLLAVGWGF